MKISKLFHWLYAILMFLPFGLLVYNAFASMWSGQTLINYSAWYDFVSWIDEGIGSSGLTATLFDTYDYLVVNIFGFDGELVGHYISDLLTYWTSVSIIWLVFDVFMYVPLLVHRWIDKAKIE